MIDASYLKKLTQLKWPGYMRYHLMRILHVSFRTTLPSPIGYGPDASHADETQTFMGWGGFKSKGKI
jgi:hypothetical protein